MSLQIDLKISKPALCNLAKLNRVKRSGHISLGSKSQMVFLLWKVFFESLTVTGIAIIEGFILIDGLRMQL